MSSDNESTVAAVAVKLPAIWSDNPATWFFQAEAQFAIKGITVEKPKYFYVVANLPAEVAIRVASFLEVVPEVKPYDTLKGALLSAYTLNEYQRAEALANLPPLGDQRPSELLAQIRQLLPVGHKDCFRSKYDFLSRQFQFLSATQPGGARIDISSVNQLTPWLHDAVLLKIFTPGPNSFF